MIEFPCSWTDKINIMEITVLPRVICKFNVFTIIKILMPLLTQLKKETIKKYVPEWKRPQIPRKFQAEKNTADVITRPNFKLYNRALATKKTVLSNLKTRREDLKTNPQGHLVLDKIVKSRAFCALAKRQIPWYIYACQLGQGERYCLLQMVFLYVKFPDLTLYAHILVLSLLYSFGICFSLIQLSNPRNTCH